MTGPTVVVVGGGALGLATAEHLVRRGLESVTVIERDHVAGASSGLSVGIVETQYVEELDIALRVRSRRYFDALEAEHRLDFVRNGYARLAHTAEDLELFQAAVGYQHQLGVNDATVLTAEELARLVPGMLVEDITGALFGPSDGYVDGAAYCDLLTALVKGSGGVVRQQTTLRAATRKHGRFELDVSTKAGPETIVADVVVNAAGAWASHVGGLLGSPVNVQPHRHQALVVRAHGPSLAQAPCVMDYVPHTGALGLYFRPERSGDLIVGLHSEESVHLVPNPDDYSRTLDERAVEQVVELFAARFPEVEQATVTAGWSGLYPICVDGLPQVGPSPTVDGLFLCVGAGGSGIQLSPALGDLAANWIVGDPGTGPEVAALSPSRSITTHV